MAPKQQAAPKNPPPADSSTGSSSDEEDDVPETQVQSLTPKKPQNPESSDSDEDQSSSGEEEEEEDKKKQPSVQKSAKSDSDSDSDEDDDAGRDDAGSDSDSSETTPQFKIEPKADAVKPSRPVQVVIASPAKSAVSSQKKGKTAADEKKSPAFTRIFGDDDEVAVLKGVDEFRKKTGKDPNVERDGFFEFMKKTLKIDVTKAQLMDKIRRLKKKYQTHAKKGEDPTISKPHELKLYELSKKVWAGDVAESAAKPVKRKAVKEAAADDVASEGVKSAKKAKLNADVVVKENGGTTGGLELVEKVKSEPEGVWDAYPYFKEAIEAENSGYCSKRLVDLNKIGAKKAKEMDEKWKGFHAKELELKLLRLELENETTKLALDVLKP